MRRALILVVSLTAVLTVFGVRAFVTDTDADPAFVFKRDSRAEQIASLEQQAADRPDDGDIFVRLSSAYLQRVRETADPSYYALAETAVERALSIRPTDPDALTVAGAIAASKHDFAEALEYATRAHVSEPTLIAAYSVKVDALVELGRYEEAVEAAQEMADLRPDFAALSRISYLRELHGDLDGAIQAMRAAAAAGTGVREDRVWALTQLGVLYLTSGDVDAAARVYDETSSLLPEDPAALFGQARLAIARGDHALAEGHLRAAVARRPMPEYLIALGDVLAVQGRASEADDQYATVRAIQQLFAASGADTDIELAAFDADQGVDPAATYAAALAVYARRPSVGVADVVAWAAYKAGDIAAAQEYIGIALRLGTKDARFTYHAAMIAEAAGDPVAARARFADAEAMRLALPPAYAAELERRLAAR